MYKSDKTFFILSSLTQLNHYYIIGSPCLINRHFFLDLQSKLVNSFLVFLCCYIKNLKCNLFCGLNLTKDFLIWIKMLFTDKSVLIRSEWVQFGGVLFVSGVNLSSCSLSLPFLHSSWSNHSCSKCFSLCQTSLTAQSIHFMVCLVHTMFSY